LSQLSSSLAYDDGRADSQPACLVLGALRQFGPRNLSIIANICGLPKETVRYKVKKQLREMGFRIEAVPNRFALGLSPMVGTVKLTRSSRAAAASLLEELSVSAYLSYFGKIALRNEYMTVFNPPARHVDELVKVLDELVSAGAIQDYRLHKVKEVRYPHTAYEFFDFKDRQWRPDSNSRHRSAGEVVETCRSGVAHTPVDAIDIAILAELEKDAFASMVDVGRTLGRDPRLVRYHFQEHVVARGLVAGHLVSWQPTSDREASTLHMWIMLDEAEAVDFFSSLPFCRRYMVTEDGRLFANLCFDTEHYPALSGIFRQNGLVGEVALLD